MARFRHEQNLGLTDKEDGSKCHSKMPPETQEMIGQLLTNLTLMDINYNTPRYVIHLAKLTNMAVCHYHRVAL